MSTLDAKERKAIPTSKFAGPGRTFPIPDKSHAEAAIRDAPISEHAGNISSSEESSIVSAAKRKLKARALRGG